MGIDFNAGNMKIFILESGGRGQQRCGSVMMIFFQFSFREKLREKPEENLLHRFKSVAALPCEINYNRAHMLNANFVFG